MLAYGGCGFVLVFALPFVLGRLGWDADGGVCGGAVRVICVRDGNERDTRVRKSVRTPVGHVSSERFPRSKSGNKGSDYLLDYIKFLFRRVLG